MTVRQIIDKFFLYTGDQTEFSTQEAVDLVNKIVDDVSNDRPWEMLKKTASGTITITNGVASITLPTDFRQFVENNAATDIAIETNNNASPKGVFVGAQMDFYQLVNFSDRRQVSTQRGFCYPDYVKGKIIFSQIPNGADYSYEFDYKYQPDELEIGDTPWFPAEYHDLVFLYMVCDHVICELFDRAKSYAPECQKQGDDMMNKLRYWNSQLRLN